MNDRKKTETANDKKHSRTIFVLVIYKLCKSETK